MPKRKYNTPHRNRVVKTRMTDEEYDFFLYRLSEHDISQAEFIRRAICEKEIVSVIRIPKWDEEFLNALGKLTAEYGRIGNNLNQIARHLNEYGTPYQALASEVRASISELAALKFEILQKVSDAIGDTETYKL